MRLRQATYQKDSDLLKAFRNADFQAKYTKDIDEKLVNYHQVIDLCAQSDKCFKKKTTKRNQVLFWTYQNIGDLFLQKNLDTFDVNNYLLALDSYQHALALSELESDQRQILNKIRDVYFYLEDKNGEVKASSKMAELVDDALKAEAFLILADNASTKSEESYFLEQALKFVDEEKIPFLKKCQHTLSICDRLLKIYQKIGSKIEESRIREIKNQTQNILN